MSKPLALIIEDDRDSITMYQYVLESTGYTTESFTSGKNALERLDFVTPNIILLDLNLPLVSGSKILDKIHNEERLKSVSVIVITGHSNLASDLRADSEFLLLKPVSVDQLTNMILRLKDFDLKKSGKRE